MRRHEVPEDIPWKGEGYETKEIQEIPSEERGSRGKKYEDSPFVMTHNTKKGTESIRRRRF